MTSIPLGPLALPAAPLLLLSATLLAAWLAQRWTRPPMAGWPAAGTLVQQAVLVALLVARVTHLAIHAESYAAEPWSALDLRDGGWHAAAGLAGGIAWMAWQAWRRASWRRGLAAASLAGLAVWSAGTLALARLEPRELPDLVLSDLATGQPVRLREAAAGRPLVLSLWASWCGPCRRELPVLAAAQQRHPEVVFVFANQGETPDVARQFLAAERLALSRVLLDPASQLLPAMGSSGLPTTVFFDRQGQRVDAHMGALSGAALAARLRVVQPR